jgi:antitoxin MazE
MTTTIQKWGNSLALRIPSAMARQIRVGEGDSVQLRVDRDSLRVRPTPPRYRLKDLVRRVTPRNRPGETNWGGPVGREVW